MEIEYCDSEVTWCYGGKSMKYYTEGIEFASEDNDLIYIEVYYNNVYEYQYVSFEGKLILSYCVGTETVTIIDADQKKKVIKIPLIHDLSISNNQRFFVLAGKDVDSKLIEYTFQGEIVNEYFPPRGYLFYRLGQVKSEVNVVCQGNEETKDNFGRNDWNFTLNAETGEWRRQSLAY
jgi:hypothetical protein